jgi:hypothetical protein
MTDVWVGEEPDMRSVVVPGKGTSSSSSLGEWTSVMAFNGEGGGLEEGGGEDLGADEAEGEPDDVLAWRAAEKEAARLEISAASPAEGPSETVGLAW